MAPENTDGAEAAAATPAADPGDAEQLQILIEGNQFEVPLAALEEVTPESSAPERATPRETDFSVLLATFDREDAAAKQFLGDALEYNPGNEFALLNLGFLSEPQPSSWSPWRAFWASAGRGAFCGVGVSNRKR